MSSLFAPSRPPHILKSLIGAALLVGPVAGCVGTEVGNPQNEEFAEVTINTRGIDRLSPSGLTLANGITFSEVWVAMENVEFESGPDCEIETETDEERPNVVELISGDEFPGYAFNDIAPVEYCEFEIRLGALEENLPAGAPPELADFAILARGTAPDGRPFELRSTDEDIDLEGIFELTAGQEPLFLLFALNEWFTLDALGAAEGDDLILISDDDNSEIFADFEERLESTAFLVRDANGDGVLQDGEINNPIARGEVEADDEVETDE